MSNRFLYNNPALGIPTAYSTGGFVSLNSATTWIAHAFVADESVPLVGIWLLTTARIGTDANISITVDLRADVGGNPTTDAIETHTQTGGWPTANNSHTYIPLAWSTPLVAGTRYWIVMRNTSAAPATDYLGVYHVSFNCSWSLGTASLADPTWAKKQSADSGITWGGTAVPGATGVILKYATGGLAGPYYNGSSPAYNNGANCTYGDNSYGLEFRTPVAINVVGAQMQLRGQGTPVGPFYLEVWVNRVRVQSAEFQGAFLSASAYPVVVVYPRPVTIPAGSWVAVMARASGGASATHSLYSSQTYATSNIEEIKSLRPFGGQVRAVALSSSGAWTDYDTLVLQAHVLLCDVNPYPDACNRRGSILMR